LVLVDITGGLETATYTYAGVGDPEVVVCDFDDETDDQAELAASLDDFAARIRERSDHPDDLRAAAGYEDDAARARRWAAEDYD
jgi:cell pole-organizing protein PopZ